MLYNNLIKGIRRNIIKNNYIYTQIASLAIGPAQPNPKSLVILNELPLNTTNNILNDIINNNNIPEVRKVEIEPGCAIHIIDQVNAEYSAKKIQKQLNLRTYVKNTCLPSIVLQNLPNNITTEMINQAFEEFKPKTVRFSGKNNISITVGDVESAIQIEKIVRDITLGSTKLQQHTTKTPEGRYLINISNLPQTVDIKTALKTISNVVSSQFPTATFSTNSGSTKVIVRLNHQKQYYRQDTQVHLERLARMISFSSHTPTNITVSQQKKPALFLHNVLGIPEERLRKVCMEENSAERIQMTWRSKDITGDLAVAYFKSDVEAQQAMKWIRASNLQEKKIKPSFQHVSEPAVRLIGFPSNLTKSKFFQLFASFKVARIDVLPANQGVSDAIVVLSSPKDAERMVTFVNNQNPGGHNMKAVQNPVDDWCIEFTFPEGSIPSTLEIQTALQRENLSVKSVATDTNISAYVAFDTFFQASKSQNSFVSGNIKLISDSDTPSPTAYHGGGSISSSVSIYPSYAIEVIGVPQDQSAEYVVDAIKDDVDILKAHRAGTVKFKKHLNVVKGMRALSKVVIDGNRLKPVRNHPVLEEGDTEYDNIDVGDKFDREQYHFMLRDYLSAEPAIRYQMAKNYFERALYSAEGLKEPSYILDNNCPSSIRLEVKELLNSRANIISDIDKHDSNRTPVPPNLEKKLKENTSRLFELFLQREDMLKYSSDFAEIEATLGPASTEVGDVTNWNNFIIDNTQEFIDFNKAVKDFNPDLVNQVIKEIPPKVRVQEKPVLSDTEEVVDEEEEEEEDEPLESPEVSETITEYDEDMPFDDQEIEDDYDDEGRIIKQPGDSKFSVSSFRDYDGHRWNAIVIHDDSTQNVTSEGRVMLYRVLMVIGNFRGVGGYGMGKGQTPQLALESSFRDALNNLLFLDLHENACFAHDLFGRENNCYVYIRATPKERAMVANPVMREMLNSFGIISCSVKVIGRRQPYAMVRAFFKALVKHKNLDEIAKERGARYLTLKWMHDKGL